MWPNLSQYTPLMGNACLLRARNAQKQWGVRVVPKGAKTAAVAQFDSLEQAKAFMERVLKDHPDWTVELLTFTPSTR